MNSLMGARVLDSTCSGVVAGRCQRSKAFARRHVARPLSRSWQEDASLLDCHRTLKSGGNAYCRIDSQRRRYKHKGTIGLEVDKERCNDEGCVCHILVRYLDAERANRQERIQWREGNARYSKHHPVMVVSSFLKSGLGKGMAV